MQQPPASPQARREVRRDTPLRRARTCYGHLAGVAGVQLMDELRRRGWLEIASAPSPGVRRVAYVPTAAGAMAMAHRGVAVPAAKAGRPAAFACLDWTERRPHLGGALGRAIAAALFDAGRIIRLPDSRAVILNGSPERWLNP